MTAGLTSINLGQWVISEADTQQYLAAVGDELPIYRETGIAPPLSLAARVVGRLLERLSLPAGTVHSLQDFETVEPARMGAEVAALASVEPVRERGGMRFLSVAFTVADAQSDRELLKGRTTVLLPGDGAPSKGNESNED